MKDFEEQFPSLKDRDKIVILEFNKGLVPCQKLSQGTIEDLGDYPEEELPNIPDLITKPKKLSEFFGKTYRNEITEELFTIEDIQENCLDKQKVKIVLKKARKMFDILNNFDERLLGNNLLVKTDNGMDMLDWIEKELGL